MTIQISNAKAKTLLACVGYFIMLFYYVLEQSEGYIFLIFFQGQPIQLGTSYKVDTEFIF